MRMSACIDDAVGWMSNRLQLNALMTESATSLPFRVCSDHVTPSAVVRDLGIYLDSDVSRRSQEQSHTASLLLPPVWNSLPQHVTSAPSVSVF